MWTVDSRCSQCGKKEVCADRTAIIPDLVSLSNSLNIHTTNVEGPGDGMLVMVCNDFQPK